MINDCCGLIGKIFGHKFEAIYEEEFKDPGIFNNEVFEMLNESKTILLALDFNITLEILTTKDQSSKYIQSVCTRCGKVVKDVN